MAKLMSDKVCIITGASSGIGEVVAKKFASQGNFVTLCGRNQDRLQKVKEQCVQLSGGHAERFLTIAGDNNDHSIRKTIVEATMQQFGRLDVLIASAGILPHNANILSATEETYDRIMNTNTKMVAFMIQLAVPYLEKTKGNIVVLSSIISTLSTSSEHITAMSKAALDQLTKCLVLNLGPKGIRINNVCPGFIPTGIVRERGGDPEEIAQVYRKIESPKHPLHGRLVSVDDVLEAVTFLASDTAASITGECIRVDGGRSQYGYFVA